MMKGLTLFSRAAAIAAALWITAPVALAADALNVNQASVDELVALNGIGPVYAERIVEYRSEHGGFDSVSELTAVQGIGDKTVAAIKDQITVDE
ncbi:helix-hairpin-helix domain-containing protein [Guyparkeria hydrothermalis]|uniref:ComEA family DNA-binding protein n=1 Tax=Guyparkeria hydrothermalis TaxID=923 RepID=UPI0020221B7C|nr:helix-hairpin-helix domain-containing protein [Guyparkeria hydrothermalis]MCL7744754.1 helix-hairpin-helix domain-containing protein [Guyparkeria hydrothermalis]